MLQIGVIGSGNCSPQTAELAEAVGREIAKRSALLICGGLGGVMEAAARGARQEGGITVGILPGTSPDDANPYIDIAIVTGLGHARNVLIVHSAHVLIALEGEYGTLSEIAIALKIGKPVVGLRTCDVSGKIIRVNTPYEAVQKAVSSATRSCY